MIATCKGPVVPSAIFSGILFLQAYCLNPLAGSPSFRGDLRGGPIKRTDEHASQKPTHESPHPPPCPYRSLDPHLATYMPVRHKPPSQPPSHPLSLQVA